MMSKLFFYLFLLTLLEFNVEGKFKGTKLSCCDINSQRDSNALLKCNRCETGTRCFWCDYLITFHLRPRKQITRRNTDAASYNALENELPFKEPFMPMFNDILESMLRRGFRAYVSPKEKEAIIQIFANTSESLTNEDECLFCGQYPEIISVSEYARESAKNLTKAFLFPSATIKYSWGILELLDKIPEDITVLPCLNDWIYFKHTGKCYFFSDNDELYLYKAKEECAFKKKNAVLASIPDKITNDFILKNVKTWSSWIGLEKSHDFAQGGFKWRWMDFTPLKFSNWDINMSKLGYQNHPYFRHGYFIGELKNDGTAATNPGKWVAIHFSSFNYHFPRGFVCQYTP